MTRPDYWTDEQEARLLEVCQDTHRIADIAHALEPVREGVTRNSVIGKIARMRRRGHVIDTTWDGMNSRPQKRTGRMPAKPKPAPYPASMLLQPKPRRGLPPPEPPRPDPPIRSPRLLTLMELGPHHCRWPIGDEAPFLFCGAVAEPGRPYCPGHVRIARGGQGR